MKAFMRKKPLLFCLLLIPAWIIVPFWIRRNSPVPALFCQERVGKHGRRFTMYKFRTMHNNAEADTGPVWAVEDDPRTAGVPSTKGTLSI